MDIDCFINVIITGCDIAVVDDCIALKSDSSRLGADKPCEHVVVANCTLTSLPLSRDGEADDLKTIEPPALLRWNHASQLVIDHTLQAADGKSFA